MEFFNGLLTWIMRGAYYEDKQEYNKIELRSFDHFYTLRAQNGIGDARRAPLTDEVKGWLPSSLVHSFAWASQRNIVGPSIPLGFLGSGASVGPNTETWQNARDYQLAALTSPSKAARDQNLAHTLYALGHVLHLNQDLSQPDHVRNDAHPPWHAWIEKYGIETYYNQPGAFPLRPRGWPSWRDAGFTKLEDFWDRKRYTGTATALNNDAAGAAGQQLGLAEYSNGNFIGEDATYAEDFNPSDRHYFPYPSRLTSTDFLQARWQIWMNRAPITLPDGTSGQGIYLRKVSDGIGFPHHSRFLYLGVKHPVPNGPIARVENTINSVNVLKDYHDILIPKAIEYSAGILDYFFRGKLGTTVTPNGDGTYQLAIQNLSGTDLKGGTFELYWDDPDSVRSRVTEFSVPWNEQSDLPDGQSVVATLRPPAGLVQKYLLVYRGTIGTSGGNPLDPVDAGIAIAIGDVPKLGQYCIAEVWYEIGDNRTIYAGDPEIPDEPSAQSYIPASLVATYLAQAESEARQLVSGNSGNGAGLKRTKIYRVNAVGCFPSADPGSPSAVGNPGWQFSAPVLDSDYETPVTCTDQPYEAFSHWRSDGFPMSGTSVPLCSYSLSARAHAFTLGSEQVCQWTRTDTTQTKYDPACQGMSTIGSLRLDPPTGDFSDWKPPGEWEPWWIPGGESNPQYGHFWRFASTPNSGSIYPHPYWPDDSRTVSAPDCCSFDP